jgi:hypothetical protein
MANEEVKVDCENKKSERPREGGHQTKATTRGKKSEQPIITIDYSFLLKNDVKFAYTYSDDDESLGSSVCSGLRNSLHSSMDFNDLENDSSWDSDALSFGDQEDLISWREPPEISESDWTLTVKSIPDGKISHYHVHKSLFVHGYKRGDFFETLFGYAGDDKEEELNKPISIHEDAARLIPLLLDYVYSLDDELNISSKSAAGLRHLSQFFGMKTLAKRVLSFMQEDICVDNARVYIKTAMAFDDLQILKLCADRCAEQIDSITPSSSLLTDIDPSFMLDIVSSKRFNSKKHSRHMSKIIAVYCIGQKCDIDGSVFEELTSVEYLPSIDQEAALPLLMLETRLVDESADESSPLSNLQKRSIKALLPVINGQSAKVNTADRKSRQRALNRIPKKVLVELLSRSLT